MDVYVRRKERWQAVSGATDPSESESRVRTFAPRDFDGVFPLGPGLFKKDLANRGAFQAVVPLQEIERHLYRGEKQTRRKDVTTGKGKL